MCVCVYDVHRDGKRRSENAQSHRNTRRKKEKKMSSLVNTRVREASNAT